MFLALATACARGDVGAPCNHGKIDPPESQVLTFPALTCNSLLCVYGNTAEPPKDPCQLDVDCNPGAEIEKFECYRRREDDPAGTCRLSNTFVLERSMCSKRCSSDADCRDGGVGHKVLAPHTNCERGFKCVRLQSLGEFCCEKLCVCDDDLGDSRDVDEACESGQGCCDDPMTRTPGCGG